MNILVLATNIKTEMDKLIVSSHLNTHSDIFKWTIDQDDVDCVLRIKTDKLTVSQLIELIKHHNFECKELE